MDFYNRDVMCLDRDNIGLLAKLSAKTRDANANNVEFVVATTHLLYNPKREDVRLAQLVVLLAGKFKNW